ncbi:MAG: polysaccharide deacetylase family protein [Gemmataceae bacterium]|nr:polysaccharide deacetylase family protein [Gemmataceae bacterium]
MPRCPVAPAAANPVPAARPPAATESAAPLAGPAFVASFDIEEHHRIEAAADLEVSSPLRREYGRRMEVCTRRLLDDLAEAGVRATFFVVGDITRTRPQLIRAIRAAGHEVGSHSWDHRRIHRLTPAEFREDLRRSKDALEQVTGGPVYGFRAPTFSLVRQTGWAVDALAECGFVYDSSVFPVRHDRYGIPDAPRGPFVAEGRDRDILELPLLTYRVAGLNLPVAGGGYFRLFPPAVMRAGLRQAAGTPGPSVAMLYFHPWEFDPDQPRLPLGRAARWRTYVGVGRTAGRLRELLGAYPFRRAIDVVRGLQAAGVELPRFSVVEEPKTAGRFMPLVGR